MSLHRVIPAIGKHIVAQHIIVQLVIRVDKPSHSRVIITALEVVEACFLVVDVAAVAEGVGLAEGRGQRAGGGQYLAPGVIGISHHLIAGSICQTQYITLRVFQVEIFGAAVSHGGWAGAVVGIVQVGGAIEAILLVCFWSKREELSFTFERSKPSTHVQTKYKYRYTHKNHN